MKITRRSLLKGMASAGVVAAVPAKAEARERQKAGPDDVGMLYDSTLCIGCKACVSACKVANDLPPTVGRENGGYYDAPTSLDGNTKNIIKLYEEGPRHAYMKMQCMHCIFM